MDGEAGSDVEEETPSAVGETGTADPVASAFTGALSTAMERLSTSSVLSPHAKGVETMSAADHQPTQAPGSPLPIAVLVGSWLPASETFVYDQLSAQRKTKAHVIATSRTAHGDRFPYDPLTVLPLAQALSHRYLGYCPALERALTASGARLVFAHFGLNGAFAVPVVQRLQLPLVVMFHGHDVGGLLPQNRYTLRYARYQRLAPALFDCAHLLLCASSELRDVLLKLGAPADKLRVHRLGIDLSRFSPPKSDEKALDPLVLMVGRLVEKKGMSDGLQAFARVREHHPRARLRIIGSGPLRRALTAQAARLGLADAVEFLGARSHAEVGAAMRAAHVLLTPSVTTQSGDRESGVIVIKEAAASELPTVGTWHGGIPEIVESGSTGLLVPEHAVDELAEALDGLLSDAQLRREMGARARLKMIREYDQRVQNDNLEQMLLEVAGA